MGNLGDDFFFREKKTTGPNTLKRSVQHISFVAFVKSEPAQSQMKHSVNQCCLIKSKQHVEIHKAGSLQPISMSL